MPAFISYAHKDRQIAGRIKSKLAPYGIECFLAHEDLKPSVEWQVEIRRRLKACSVFLALISKNFHTSDWTDQEVGMAVAWRKTIVPLSLNGCMPYGFAGKYQAIKLSGEDMTAKCTAVVETLAKHRKHGPFIREALVLALTDSNSFAEAAASAKRVAAVGGITADQLNRIVLAGCSNVDIYRGFDARDIIGKLITERENELDAEIVQRFRDTVKENW